MGFAKGRPDYRKNAVEGKRHIDLLKDPDVRNWYEDHMQKSELTAGVYLRGLGLYCKTLAK